jgi:hypothetical protein
MGGPIHHSYLRPCAASSLSASPSYGVNSLCSRLGAPRGHVGRGVALRVRCDRVIGIDLGTSNSAAAVVMGRSGKPEIVPIDGGHATMPSWVHYSAQGAELAITVRVCFRGRCTPVGAIQRDIW